MNYLIFAAIALTLFWLYHRIKYTKQKENGWKTFSNYLWQENKEVIAFTVQLWEIILVVAVVVGFIYAGGMLLSLIF